MVYLNRGIGEARTSRVCNVHFSTERSGITIVFPPEEFVMKHMRVHNADCMDLADRKCGRPVGRPSHGLRRRCGGAHLRLTQEKARSGERLKAIELAIAKYNAKIRILKKQMQEGTANSCTFRQALARYQQWREDLDVQLGLERAY
jgi:hypothetical protein